MFLTHFRSAWRPIQKFYSAVEGFFSENPFGLSFVELAFTLIISNAALLFLVFTYLVDTEGAQFSWELSARIIEKNFVPTEVLVYLLALISPALWIMAFNWRARKHVAFYWGLLLIQGIIVVGSAYIYGKAKTGGVKNVEFVTHWSSTCLILGLVIWYVTMVYNRAVISKIELRSAPSGSSIIREIKDSP